MPTETLVPKKQPKKARPSADLDVLTRCIEENRVLAEEVAQLLSDLQICVSRLHEIRRARALKFPSIHY